MMLDCDDEQLNPNVNVSFPLSCEPTSHSARVCIENGSWVNICDRGEIATFLINTFNLLHAQDLQIICCQVLLFCCW